MTNYNYYSPGTVEEAIDLLQKKDLEKPMILAGGTDMMVQIREGMKKPSALIDISNISQLKTIETNEKRVKIGALVTHSEIVESLSDLLPALAEAAAEVGSPQIQNQGTIGGNFGNASPAADTVPPLYVYDAEVVIVNTAGTRREKISDIFQGPGSLDLKDHELITEFAIPKPEENTASAFEKLGKRNALAISVVNAAVNIKVDKENNTFEDVKIAVGSVAPTVIRLGEVEKILNNAEVCEDNLKKAKEKASEIVSPITDIRSTENYRKRVTGAVVYKALKKALNKINL